MVFKPLFLLLPYTFFLGKMLSNQILNFGTQLRKIFRGGQQLSEFHHTNYQLKVLTVLYSTGWLSGQNDSELEKCSIYRLTVLIPS
jgi:hypothetical protein